MVNVSKMSIASLNCLNLYSHFKNESQKIEKKMIIIINPENGGSVVKMYVCIKHRFSTFSTGNTKQKRV